ncbi:MAG TPA: orotate phosphoribosyltransferase [Rhodospirillales bacterium]|jgi:orotate phosphoribosyltransferase|nr:orotate phosphoribosyltransferase [Rhodospirillales bacterium]
MPTSSPSAKPDSIGLETARILLDIKAVNFRPQEPYLLTSGWASPVYIDCRKLISYPDERRRVMDLAVTMIESQIGCQSIDTVAGGETAGIPYAAWIAEAMSKAMIYVRKKPKGFGRMAQIEGDLAAGSRVLLVEDLATDGASKILFIDALREAGGAVTDAFVVFFYGVFPGALKGLRRAGVRLHHLADWRDVLVAATEGEYFPETAIAAVRQFLNDPAAWSAAHGGKTG